MEEKMSKEELKPKHCPICVHCDKSKVSYGISNHDCNYACKLAVYPFSQCTAIRIEQNIDDLDQYNEKCSWFEENKQIDLFTKNRIKTDKTGN